MTATCDICGNEFKSERGVKVHKGRSHDRKYHDEDWLRRQYVDNGRGLEEIAEQTNTDGMTIHYWLKKNGIETRSRGSGDRGYDLPPKDELKVLYCDKKDSTCEIAKKYGVVPNTVSKWLSGHGIEVRSRAESLDLKVPPEEELRRLHYKESLKQWEIANEYGVANRTVSGWFDKYGIETRTYCEDEASRWQGGHLKYYGPDWPEQREKRLEYDNQQCVICGMGHEKHQEKYGQELHVHHIHKLRKFERDDGVDYEQANDISNLITLCAKHHKVWEDIPLRPQQ